MNKCATRGCTGHLGKFTECADEALWTLSMESRHDQDTGSVDAYGWYALFIMDSAKDVTMDDGRTVTVPAGNYILTESDGGFVYTLKYDTEPEARAAFAVADRAYCQWMDDNEPEPLAANAGSID